MPRCLLAVVSVLHLLLREPVHARVWMSLDGEWQFTLMEEVELSAPAAGDTGPRFKRLSSAAATVTATANAKATPAAPDAAVADRSTLAGYTATMSGKIQVPGAWEAQGYGTETATMRHQVITGDAAGGRRGAVGVYSRTFSPPSCPIPGSKTILTVDQGVHRHGIFRVAGKVVGEHRGYLTPFEADISAFVEGGRGVTVPPIEVEVELDGGRNPASDALQGTCDIDDDGTGLGGWAGLNGHVGILCRPPIFIDGGVGNVVQPHVQHPAVTTASIGTPLEISVSFVVGGGGGGAVASVDIFDNVTGAMASVGGTSTPGAVTGNVTLKVTIPAVKLWSPENRSLYTAIVTLHSATAAAAVLDTTSTRFGVRTVVVDGYKLLLNGQRLYLAGYGDDSVYPLTVSPPRTKAEYAGKLQFAHEHGFNFVRHHSHTLPPESAVRFEKSAAAASFRACISARSCSRALSSPAARPASVAAPL